MGRGSLMRSSGRGGIDVVRWWAREKKRCLIYL